MCRALFSANSARQSKFHFFNVSLGRWLRGLRIFRERYCVAAHLPWGPQELTTRVLKMIINVWETQRTT
jgi:hypothetical protein